MILNFINEKGGSNKVVDFVNGETAIIVYNHFERQFENRISNLTRLGYHRMFNYDVLLDTIIDTIKFKYNEIINEFKVAINIDIPIKVEGKLYFLEISTIVHSSYPTFNYSLPNKAVRPEYRQYFRDKKIKTNKKVITIETVAFSVKCRNERHVTFNNEKLGYNKSLNFNPIIVSKRQFEKFLKTLPEIRFSKKLKIEYPMQNKK